MWDKLRSEPLGTPSIDDDEVSYYKGLMDELEESIGEINDEIEWLEDERNECEARLKYAQVVYTNLVIKEK